MSAAQFPERHIFTPIVIVGSGFAGIGTAIRLQQKGFNDFLMLEQANNFGGTWRDNTYPGAECDVPSHLYSFSFEPNPHWSKAFAPQQEIQKYLLHCAQKHKLASKALFNAEVVNACFNEAKGEWTVTLADGCTVRCRLLIMGNGGLSKPSYPVIEGQQSFQGKIMHTARWHESFDYAGKKVAVIGTGASAIQLIPELAKTAAQVVVFQRTPAWVMPKWDTHFSAHLQQEFADHPNLRKALRYGIYWGAEAMSMALIWNSPLAKSMQWLGELHLKTIKDNVLRTKLTPDYKVGCKRMLISNDYYPAMQRDNVQLVTNGIKKIDSTGIHSQLGEHYPVDAIVYATGFQVNVAGSPFPITGLDSRQLMTEWTTGSEAYKGININGYPNLCLLMGPNTAAGHTSVLVYLEGQIEYVLNYTKTLFDLSFKYLDIKKSAQDSFNKMIQRRMKYTVWTTGCQSWYLTKEGKNSTLWPGFSWEYRLRTAFFNHDDYERVGAKYQKGVRTKKQKIITSS
ncbi:MAG TPA: NAD(P)/FAD-dependent oxidoreductase [Agitococcus sp.]|nr:NAD(P)/FAD-dependent oxidoreductase [Agitococcus sp.]